MILYDQFEAMIASKHLLGNHKTNNCWSTKTRVHYFPVQYAKIGNIFLKCLACRKVPCGAEVKKLAVLCC